MVEAILEDLDDVTKALTAAREIVGALTVAGKGLDDGLVTSCTGWGKHLDTILHNVAEERSALERRMSGNGRMKIKQHVDIKHIAAVSEAREEMADDS